MRPGVLGNEASSQYESFRSSDAEMAALDEDGTPPHPRLRRTPRISPLHPPSRIPRPLVPEVLSGGDHPKISRWRRERTLEKTFRNRPDLLETAELSDRDREFLAWLQRR